MSNRPTAREIVVGASLILAAVGSYELLNHIGRPNLISIDTPLDSLIPLLPIFVIPYLSFIPLVFLAIPLLALRDRVVFKAFAWAVFVTQMILNVLYVLVPATVVRPPLEGSDVFSMLLRDLVWGLDEPVNTFPSNHVALSVIAIFALARLSLSKWVTLALQLWLGVICVSTLFVHQHVIPDVIAGAAIGGVCFAVVYRIVQRGSQPDHA
jgi:membrane-associated phospholipid phosphatase